MVISVQDINKKWWQMVLSKVSKAVVFVDSAAADCINWCSINQSQALLAFLNAGAINVRELSSFESGRTEEKKCVFIVNSMLIGITLDVIRTIVQSSKFEYCIVITPFPASTHTFAKFPDTSSEKDENEAFYFLEDCLLQWMGNMNYTVEILHIPVCIVPFTSSCFVTPSVKDLFPSFEAKNASVVTETSSYKIGDSVNDMDFTNIPVKKQIKTKMLCSILNSLLQSLNAREDLYTVGSYSRLVAKQMELMNSTKTRRKMATNRASLLLVDRTLDLPSAVSRNADALMDKIFRILPKISGNLETDVTVNVSALCDSISCNPDESTVTGTFGQLSTGTSRSIIRSSIYNKQKETLMEINRYLVDALREENIGFDTGLLKSSKPSAEQLSKKIDLFSGRKQSIRNHRGLLQQSLAVVQTLKNPANKKIDELINLEKLFIQSFDDTEACLLELVHLVRTRREKNITIEDILLLLVYIFSLNNTFMLSDPSAIDKLRSVLSDGIIADREILPEHIRNYVGNTDKDVCAFVRNFFDRLSSLDRVYRGMKGYRSVFDAGDDGHPAEHKPLLKTIMNDVFSPSKPELLDIEYKSGGIGTMLKSGFSLFVNVSNRRPNDNPLLIVYVIGGITASEIRQINEVVSNSNTQVIVGSTTLSRPVDILTRLLDEAVAN